MPDPEITSEAFTAFLSQIRMKEIWVERCSCSVMDRRRLEANVKSSMIEFGHAPSLHRATSKRAEISVLHGARIFLEGEKEDLALLTVTYRVEYETPSKMSPELFDLFRRVTLRLHTTPFAREWIHEQSLRMGIAPILMPLAVSHPAAVGPAERRKNDRRR